MESPVALRNIRKILEIASSHNWKKITGNFVRRTDEATGQSVRQLKIYISRLEGRNEAGNCQKIISLLFGSCDSSFSGVPSFSPHNILVADYTIINLAVDNLSQYSHNYGTAAAILATLKSYSEYHLSSAYVTCVEQRIAMQSENCVGLKHSLFHHVHLMLT